ncbi:hypothetical protein Btru_024332 [Bulinus truncatus]|nr:hypothetical protein Btru_024332 [Bulinus truncatus]
MDKKHLPSGESVPFFVAMMIVVPVTFEVIRILLEDKLDFDMVINRKLLRVMELMISVMIFPTAAMYIAATALYKFLVAALVFSFWLVDLVLTPRYLYVALYYLACCVTYVALLTAITILIKYVVTLV